MRYPMDYGPGLPEQQRRLFIRFLVQTVAIAFTVLLVGVGGAIFLFY